MDHLDFCFGFEQVGFGFALAKKLAKTGLQQHNCVVASFAIWNLWILVLVLVLVLALVYI